MARALERLSARIYSGEESDASCSAKSICMAFVTTFVDRGRCAVQIGSGVVLGREMIAGARAVREHVESGGPLTHGLVDLSAATELHLTAEEVEVIAAENQRAAASMSPATVAV